MSSQEEESMPSEPISDSDQIAFIWSTIYQICSIIAVENLDESLSIPSNLIATTRQLLTLENQTYALLGIIDLTLYTILVEWSEKRAFYIVKQDEHSEGYESSYVSYCLFLQKELIPILHAKFILNNIPSLVYQLVNELFARKCVFSINFDAKYTPLVDLIGAGGNPNVCLAIADQSLVAVYEKMCGESSYKRISDENPGLEGISSSAVWMNRIAQSCKNIENCMRQKYPEAIVVPYGSTIIPGTSTFKSDVDMLLVCADIAHQNDVMWKHKESIEDEYIEIVCEARREYNGYAAEVSANKLLKKCVLNIQDYYTRHSKLIETYNLQYQQFHEFIESQHQYYQRYGRQMPYAPAPPPPISPPGITPFFTPEDLVFLFSLSQQGTTLLSSVQQQTIVHQSFMSMITEYIEDLAVLFAKYLVAPAGDEYDSIVDSANKKIVFTLARLLTPIESFVVEDENGGNGGVKPKKYKDKADKQATVAVEELMEDLNKPARELATKYRKKSDISTRIVKAGKAVGLIKDVKTFTHGLFPNINWEDLVTFRRSKLVCNQLIVLKNSELIKTYLAMDGSGLVRKYIALIKIFARSQRIAAASDGYISTYAWSILGLHVLLRYRLIPCVTPQALAAQHFCKGIDVSFVDGIDHLPVAFESRLRQFTLIQLLHLFFYYFSVEFDPDADVVSLRRPYMPKNVAPAPRLEPQTWRLSIEDPFETAECLFPKDLGVSITSPSKQSVIFRYINLARKGIEIGFQKYYTQNAQLKYAIDSVFDNHTIEKWQYAL